MTTVTIGIAWATARCRWCSHVQFKVQGGAGLLVRYKCSNRRCGIESEQVLE